ncbi:MAG: sulfite exporter TauE/SafE family protein [Desulfurivibrio sp.]|nr:sulfite exporter TauE/SafE family protein [Desulfurivibrio sp.]
MYFPTADIEVAFWVPPLVACVVSFFTSMGGVSGAFLLLPFQMSFLGYTSPSVSATNQLFNIVAIPGGVLRYCREGRMVWPLTGLVVAGTLPGVLLGALVRIAWLPDPRHFKLFAAAVLLYIGLKMAYDLLGRRRGPSRPETPPATGGQPATSATDHPQPAATVQISHCSLRRLSYRFHDEEYVIPIWPVFFLSLVVGMIGGIYGIGGGAIIAPFLITFFKLPVHTVAGATLMGTFVTSVAGVAFYQAIAPFYPQVTVAPDWLLGLLFGLGGMVGMYLGARCQKYVPAGLIKAMLGAILLFTAGKYIISFLTA